MVFHYGAGGRFLVHARDDFQSSRSLHSLTFRAGRDSMTWFHKLLIILAGILAFLLAVVGGGKWS